MAINRVVQLSSIIRGYIFCSFLALVLVDELKQRLTSRGLKLEWGIIRQNLQALDEAEVRESDSWYLLRGPLQ